jgi:phosphinothricin acetyltransferase
MATADLEPVSIDSRFFWFYEHTPSYRPIWVMELDGTMVGWLSFQSFYGRPAYQKTAEISIYVAPAYQRRGVGRQLLSQAIRQSPNLGLKTLVSFIFAHNKPSLQLFEKLGFQRWGYLPAVAELDSVERDLMILGCRISEQKR